MARYRIFVAEAAQKELKKLGPAAAKEIVTQIEKKLGDDPQAFGRPLTGELAGYFRLRVTGYRVVYKVIDDKVWVIVLAAGKRDEGNVDNIYDWLTGDLLTKRLEGLLRAIEADESDDTG
ncbi:MAG TPA: type II toxin-antitoxin system RelE/ParE family toxin [Longimicrobium sp.]|nr:type II toxin-antitoxin system RelE/ParE family toxin [Longimicrobium sp.]